VHGDEIGPADSSLQLAYHLLAARGDPRLEDIRRNTLVIVVPIQNPDGRERFISTNLAGLGLKPDGDAASAERDQPWPGGRSNHMMFDLNRDWFALTQPETRGHTAAILKYYPVVMVDSHEMGSDRSFFFPPEAQPINPNVTGEQMALKALLGRNNGRWFDHFGLPYFTREDFDLFYPGYGDGWPTTQGTISMTFEQGSARGLVARRSDGSSFTFADTVRSQFIAVMGTLETAASERGRFVRSFYEFRRSAIAEGRSEPVKAYVLPTQKDQASTDKLAAILTRQGIEVGRATASFTACGRSFSAGSYVISAAQPTKRLIRNLLDAETPMDPAFVREQHRRLRAGLGDEIYDVTGWSLPLLYNIEAVACATDPSPSTVRVGPNIIQPGKVTSPDAKAAFIVASGSVATSRFMARALAAGLTVRAVRDDFTLEGTAFPAGSLVVTRGENDPDLATKVGEIARQTGAVVTGFDSTWVTQGPSLGSDKAFKLRNPRIALAWDSPADRHSSGATRYVLERKFSVPVTPIRVANLRSLSPGSYDVLILPDAEDNYAASLGDAGVRALRAFVQNGGVLISLAGATSFLANPEIDLVGLRLEQATVTEAEARGRLPEAKPKAGEAAIAGTAIADEAAYRQAISEPVRAPTQLDGAILRAATDPDHWLTAGLAPRLHMMVTGTQVFRPVTADVGANVVRFEGAETLRASGIVWDDLRQQLAFKPVVTVQPNGRGYVVAFTIDPTYRGMADGLDALLMNAIYFGAARASPTR
jgi:hypothetical protein